MKILIERADDQRTEQEKKFSEAMKSLNETLEKERAAKDAEVQAYKDKATELEAGINAFREAIIDKLSQLANDDSKAMSSLRLVLEKPEFRTLLGIKKEPLIQLVDEIEKNVPEKQQGGKTKKGSR